MPFDACQRLNGPVQLNIPRDFFYGESETTIPGPNVIERSAGGVTSLEAAAKAIQHAKNPVILGLNSFLNFSMLLNAVRFQSHSYIFCRVHLFQNNTDRRYDCNTFCCLYKRRRER